MALSNFQSTMFLKLLWKKKLLITSGTLIPLLLLTASYAVKVWVEVPSEKEIIFSMAYNLKLGFKVENGKVTLRDKIYNPRVNIKELPINVGEHAVLKEDHRFYEHFGFDWRSLARVFSGGTSTITQQVAKYLFLETASTSTPIANKLHRKFIETVIAIRLETILNKDEILDIYLNNAFFGNGAFGIEAAARTYFQKRAKDLSIG